MVQAERAVEEEAERRGRAALLFLLIDGTPEAPIVKLLSLSVHRTAGWAARGCEASLVSGGAVWRFGGREHRPRGGGVFRVLADLLWGRRLHSYRRGELKSSGQTGAAISWTALRQGVGGATPAHRRAGWASLAL